MVALITGSTGKLGRELVKVLPNSLHPTREELDIRYADAVSSYIRENRPDMVIHTAALTGIKQCEERMELAYGTNVEGTANLVRAICESGIDCHFVYVSTACVFYGDKGNRTENDLPYPKNFYSLTKLLGEFVVMYSQLRKYLILRTNFVAREKWPYPKAFTDRYGTYLFADDLALAIKSVLGSKTTGILHVCGEKRVSMLELARMTTPSVEPMTLVEYKGPPLTVDMSLASVRISPFKISERVRLDPAI